MTEKSPYYLVTSLYWWNNGTYMDYVGEKESSGYDIEFFLTNTTTKKSLKIIPGEKSTHFFFKIMTARQKIVSVEYYICCAEEYFMYI